MLHMKQSVVAIEEAYFHDAFYGIDELVAVKLVLEGKQRVVKHDRKSFKGWNSYAGLKHRRDPWNKVGRMMQEARCKAWLLPDGDEPWWNDQPMCEEDEPEWQADSWIDWLSRLEERWEYTEYDYSADEKVEEDMVDLRIESTMRCGWNMTYINGRPAYTN
jgi:hypothetical protein